MGNYGQSNIFFIKTVIGRQLSYLIYKIERWFGNNPSYIAVKNIFTNKIKIVS
jgi:hypothetical protein